MSKKNASQKTFSIADKIAAVLRHIDHQDSLREIANSLDCSTSTVHGWKKQYIAGTLRQLSASSTVPSTKTFPVKRKHSELFKISIVKRYQDGETVADMCKEHRLKDNLIYTWITKYKNREIGKNMDIDHNDIPDPIELPNSGELFALRKENAKLKSVINLLLENDDNE